MTRIHLLHGREKALLRRHPWIFEGAVKEKNAAVSSGETVLVCDAYDNELATGAWSPSSQLRIRVWSFDPKEKIDTDFFRRKLHSAVEFRKKLGLLDPSGGCRLIYSESDGLPGVIVDRYADIAVLQLSSAGADFFRQQIIDVLMELPFINGVYERSDASVRQKESLPMRCGHAAGKAVDDEIIIKENGLSFAVDLRYGQKTGFYFDLRSAREKIRTLCAGKRVLNMFSYTGGFACAAMAGGAVRVHNVDSSLPALAQGEKNLALNGFTENITNTGGDVFEVLRDLERRGEKFDLVILDPPKLIPNKGAMMRGCRAYQDLARLGYKLLSRGGILCNFSCSGAMDVPLFQKITADAAIDAGVSARIAAYLEQAPDHPVLLSVPETFYLNGLITIID